MQGLRRTAWLEIDLAAIRHNLGLLRSLVGPGVRVAPVIKANAYGHGLVAVGRALDGLVDAFCLATLDEALELRAAGISARLVTLYPAPADCLDEAAPAGVELSVMSSADAAAIVRWSARRGTPARLDASAPIGVHLSVETGFYRGGLASGELVGVAGSLAACPAIRLAGVWSHLASPADASATARQLARFEEATAALSRSGLPLPTRHIAASTSLFVPGAPVMDMVRPGLAMYGWTDPQVSVGPAEAAVAAALRPAMSLRARAVAFNDVPTGEGVGYGGQWVAARPSRVAILPVGYADGFERGLQPGAGALVNGHRVPLVGVVSMDAVAVDVSDVEGVGYDDEFVLLGRQGSEAITAVDLARARNTIPWEVLTGMAARLGRVYHPLADTRGGDERTEEDDRPPGLGPDGGQERGPAPGR
jgi:alanine racemase